VEAMNLKKILILAGLYVLVLNLKIVMTLGAVIKTQPYHLLVRELVVVWREAQEGVITNISATHQKDLIWQIKN
jgi:hypothetical protein